MSDLTQTILAGTEQMANAAAGLAHAKERKTERRRVALEAVGESFKGAVKSLKEYGTWAEAKKAEADEKQVNDAYALGLTTKGDAGALGAMESTRPLTARGAKLRVELTTKAQERLAKQSGYALDAAQAHHLGVLDQEAQNARADKEERAAARREAMKQASKLWPDEGAAAPMMQDSSAAGTVPQAPGKALPQIQKGVALEGAVVSDATSMRRKEVQAIKRLMAADAIDPKEAMSKLVMLSEQERREAKDVRDDAQKASVEKGRNDRAAASRVVQRERNATYQSHLDAMEENAVAAVRLRGEAHQEDIYWHDVLRQNMLNARDDATAKTLLEGMRQQVENKRKALATDKLVAFASGWRQGEDKSELGKSLDDKQQMYDAVVKDVDDALKALKVEKPNLPTRKAGGAPTLDTEGAKALSDDELWKIATGK